MLAAILFGLEETILTQCSAKEINRYKRLSVFFLVLMSLGLTKVPVSLINIPHREYWLSPERHAETIKIITGFMLFLACILVVFLSFVHWLVTLANAQQPPEMSGFSIYVGLIILLMLIGVWSLFLIRAFHLDDHQEK